MSCIRAQEFFKSYYFPTDVNNQGLVWNMSSTQQEVLIRAIHAGYFNNVFTPNFMVAGADEKHVVGRIVIASGSHPVSLDASLLLTYNRVTGDSTALSQFPDIRRVLLEIPINDPGYRLYEFPRPLHFFRGESPLILMFAGYRDGDVYGTPSGYVQSFMVDGVTTEEYKESFDRSAFPEGKWR